ncbi:hypothetical protein NDU88_003123 [Pleurodeles waltl]|uniref:Uncharacterized protein n=1 Tax=Pleurodeles waltl TaxID=8319 RepID=A0AAV7M311_PLEWA|nr:hypothetical protein NDU88_003123 [Pleurodeles waltl]
MCRPTPRLASRSPRDSETQQIQAPGEALGGRLRHWGRAALELRWARKGSARIPLRGNPGRASIGKAPGNESREPDSVATRRFSPSTKGKTSKVVGRWRPGVLQNSVLIKPLGKCSGIVR